jgi:hypothetical protein
MVTPSPPPVGTRTIAEVNYRLIDATSTSGPTCPDVLCGEDRADVTELGENDIVVEKSYAAAADAPLFGRYSKNILSSLNLTVARNDRLPPSVDETIAGPMAWHPRLPILAAVSPTDTGVDAIHIYDFTGKISPPGHKGHYRTPCTLPATVIIRHPLLRGATRGALSWRPLGGGFTLAVGSDCGVCLLKLSDSGVGKVSVHLEAFMAQNLAGAVRLTWHPEGHLLAAVVGNGRSISIIDASTGSYVALNKSASVGLGIIHTASWSPCGLYLFTAGDDARGSFRIWGTKDWKYRTWVMEQRAQGVGDSGLGHAEQRHAEDPLVAVAWSPNGKFVLLAHRTSGLSSLQFASDPIGSLNAQVLPITLPNWQSSYLNKKLKIRTLAWDPRGRRLALAFEENDDLNTVGLVALYDTNCDPLFSAHLIGYVATGTALSAMSAVWRQGGGAVEEDDEPDWEIIEPEVETEDDIRRATLAKQQEAVRSLAFLPEAPYGAVLSVRSAGGRVSTIPLYFAVPNT